MQLDLGAAFTPLVFDVTDETGIGKAALKVRSFKVSFSWLVELCNS